MLKKIVVERVHLKEKNMYKSIKRVLFTGCMQYDFVCPRKIHVQIMIFKLNLKINTDSQK